MVLRRIFGAKGDEVKRGWRKLHNKELHNIFFAKHNYNDQVMKDEMGRACSTQGEKRNAYRIFVGRPEGKRPLGRYKCRWEDNIKLYLKERMGWYGLD
jgi:hypothetical protein